MKKKNIVRVALVTGLILMVPLVAMQFTSEVNWNLFDFIVAGALLFTTGLLLDLAMRKMDKHKVLVMAVIVFLFVWLWAELAVGVFTNWGS